MTEEDLEELGSASLSIAQTIMHLENIEYGPEELETTLHNLREEEDLIDTIIMNSKEELL